MQYTKSERNAIQVSKLSPFVLLTFSFVSNMLKLEISALLRNKTHTQKGYLRLVFTKPYPRLRDVLFLKNP